MKKRFVKMISTAVSMCMMVSLLTGCGTKNNAAKNTTTAGENKQVEKAEETGSVFKIGGIGPLTGDAAIYGQAVKNAAQIAVDEINAAGGVNGYQLSLKFEDDECDGEKSVNAYNTLKDWGMTMLMGTVTSGCCNAVAGKTAEDNMFQLTPSGSADGCIANPNSFRVCFSDTNQGSASAKYIGANSLGSKVAVIYDSSDIYSSGIYETFLEQSKNEQFEVVAQEAFTSDNKTDFSVQLQNAKDAGADLVFLPIYYKEAALILKQASTMGFDVKFFGCDGLDGLLNVENFETALAEGVMLLTPFVADAQDEKTKAFVDVYKAAYNNEIPNQFAADAYDAIYTIKAAIEKSGATPDLSVSDLCEKMKAAMVEITVEGVTGTITWDASGEPTKDPKGMVIAEGTYKAIQ